MKLKCLFLGLLLSVSAVSAIAKDDKTIKNVEVQEVTVSASRMNSQLKNLPQKIEIIDAKQIKELPSANLAEVLKRATNLDIIQYPGLSATIGMRGFSPSAHSRSYTLLLIDGRPSGSTNLAAIGLNNVERIEVVKGPYSVLYGSDAMGGVINIITKKADGQTEGSVSAEAGSFGNVKLNSSFTGRFSDRLFFGVGYSRERQDKDYRIGKNNLLSMKDYEELILDKASYGDNMDNTTYEFNQLNANLTYLITNKWQANARMAYTFAYDVETPGNYWGSYGQSKKDIDRLNLYVDLSRQTQNNTLTFSPYYTNEKDPNYSDNTEDGFISFESEIQNYGFQLQDKMTFGELNVLAGIDHNTNDYHSERWEAIGTPADPYKPDNTISNTALFSQISYITNRLDLSAGLRFDHFKYTLEANEALGSSKSDESYSTLNPSVGVQYHFAENMKGHASFGSAFSVPDAYKVAGSYKAYYEYVGNPDLKPEKSRTFDIGISYQTRNGGFKNDFTFFTTKHDDRIVRENITDTEKTYVNADKGNMNGLEWIASFDFGSMAGNKYKLELYSNWTFMFKDEVTTTDDDGNSITQDMLYTRKTNGSFGLIYGNNKNFTSRLNARYVGKRLEEDSFPLLRPDITSDDYYTDGGYTADDAVLQQPDFLLFDYSMTYSVNQHTDFGVTISNLMNENYSEKDGYNMPGRSIMAKLAYTF